MSIRYVNLGCGRRFHPDWVNIDIYAAGSGVIAHDLRKGIPLADASCDLVYHSHVLEHFRRPDALHFMQECCRVLKKGGVVRVVVPDLEQICRIYLGQLDRLLVETEGHSGNYDWIMLEMYDQTVREQSGGEMLRHLSQQPLPNRDFILQRIGEEGRTILQQLQPELLPPHLIQRLYRKVFLSCYRWLQTWYRSIRRLPLRLILGDERARAMEIGQFRLAGEVHQWMYDRYSLARLMRCSGFDQPTQQQAHTSLIPNWDRFYLDTDPSGNLRKPDSLFMEAIKI